MLVPDDRLTITSHVRQRRAQIRQSIDAIGLELEAGLAFGNRALKITALVELNGAREVLAGLGFLGRYRGIENA